MLNSYYNISINMPEKLPPTNPLILIEQGKSLTRNNEYLKQSKLPTISNQDQESPLLTRKDNDAKKKLKVNSVNLDTSTTKPSWVGN